jgi:hypothetical protein
MAFFDTDRLYTCTSRVQRHQTVSVAVYLYGGEEQ